MKTLLVLALAVAAAWYAINGALAGEVKLGPPAPSVAPKPARSAPMPVRNPPVIGHPRDMLWWDRPGPAPEKPKSAPKTGMHVNMPVGELRERSCYGGVCYFGYDNL